MIVFPALLTAMIAAPFYEDRIDVMSTIDAEGEQHAIESVSDWLIRRGHIIENMQLVMGEMPDASRKVALDVEVTDEAGRVTHQIHADRLKIAGGDRGDPPPRSGQITTDCCHFQGLPHITVWKLRGERDVTHTWQRPQCVHGQS